MAGFEKLVSDLARQVEERDGEIARLRAVAKAAELVCAHLGAIGSIYSDHCTVEDLMDALHEWDPK
jgi:hypothetical protein